MIFESKLANSTADRMILFGAGGWGEVLLEELENRMVSLPILFADNDRTKHGKRLRDRPVISPHELDPVRDLVLITTISAGDQVSAQLESHGFLRGINYFEVMENLDDSCPISVVNGFLDLIGSVKDLKILHIGPGGHLGVEMLLNAFGACFVHAVEFHSFRLKYPDVTEVAHFYLNLQKKIETYQATDFHQLKLLTRRNGKIMINPDKIRLLHPCSVTALPFQDNSFDLVLHHLVFEHVLEPEKGYEEIWRVLKPGGRTAGFVNPQDHRSMGGPAGYHPLKFLEHSREEWYSLSKRLNVHNQMTTPEHREMIKAAGFQITRWQTNHRIEITDEMWESFDPMFHPLNRDEVGILSFSFVAEKP